MSRSLARGLAAGLAITLASCDAARAVDFFAEPETLEAIVSPDGRHAAMLRSEKHGRVQVHDRVLDQSLVVVERGVQDIAWAGNDTLVAVRKHVVLIVRVSVESGRLVHATRQIERIGYVVDPLPDQRDALLFAVAGSPYRVYRVEPDWSPEAAEVSARREERSFKQVVAELDVPVLRWIADSRGAVRAALTLRNDPEPRVELLYRRTGDADWEVSLSLPPDEMRVYPLAFLGEDLLLVGSDRDRDTVALFEFDLASGRTTRLVYEHPTAQVDDVVMDYRGVELLGVVLFENGERSIRYLEKHRERFRGALERRFPDERATVASSSRDGHQLIALVSSESDLGTYYLLDTESGDAMPVGRVAPWIEARDLSPVEVFDTRSPDGTPIQSFLTQPRGANPPLLVMPHGGPLGVRDERRFDPAAQYLASKGIAVLQVNYRGSSGYGRSFLDAGKRQWGEGIEDDIEAAVRQVVESGRVDGSRICIAGISYGGYSALMSVVRHPKRYRCAATLNGVTDIALLFNSSDFAQTKGGREAFAEIVGDPATEYERLRQTSPVYRVAEIGVPVHVAQGLLDHRVDPEHAFRLLLMLELHGKQFEFLPRPEMEHSFDDLADMGSYYHRLRLFLWKYLRRS